jgi:hypothetical protein
VPIRELPRKRALYSRAKNCVVFLFVAAIALFISRDARSISFLRGTDFPHFYCAAQTILSGNGDRLYDVSAQYQCQAASIGRVGTLYNHPPFEAIFYMSVAWLPLKYAYVAWSLINLALLAFAAYRAAQEALPWDWRIVLAASLTFVPVLLCLLQGQDSILLLCLVVLAFRCLRRKRGFAGGCWLALGLFKFQITLPLVLVLLLARSGIAKREFAKGFGLVSLALTGLSAGFCGWPVFLAYPKFLLHLQAQPFAGIFSQAMANFRGLIYILFHSDHSVWTIASLCILSLAALIKVLNDWRQTGSLDGSSSSLSSNQELSACTQPAFQFAFSSSIIFSLLVSYHLNPHDLSLLLLPISLTRHRLMTQAPSLSGAKSKVVMGLLAALFLPPLHLWALHAGLYALIGLLLVALFLITPAGREENSDGASLRVQA